MPDPRFFLLPERQRRPVGAVEAAIAEAVPYRPFVVPEGREFGLGTLLGTGAGGYAQWRLLSRLLGGVPHPAAKVGSIALPILLNALSGARFREEDSPGQRLFQTALGGVLGSPLPGRIVGRLRGKKAPLKVEEGLPRLPEVDEFEDIPGLRGTKRKPVGPEQRIPGEEPDVPGLVEYPRRPDVPGLIEYAKAGGMQPTFRAFSPFGGDYPGSLFPDLPAPGQRGGRTPFESFPGMPAFPARGEQYDLFMSRPTGKGGPFVHSKDWTLLQAIKAGKVDVGVPKELIPELDRRVVYGGENIQAAIRGLKKGVEPVQAAPRAGGSATPVTEVARVLTTGPALPAALTQYPFYGRLREIVSQAFSSRLENPALALSQADAFLAQMVAEMPPQQVTKAMAILARQQKRLGTVAPDEIFATIMRGFGRAPKIAGKGRAGVKASVTQAATSEAAAQTAIAPARTIGDLLAEWSNPDDWGAALERIGFQPDSYSTIGLLTLLGRQPDLAQQPASMLPRLIAQVTAQNNVPIANALDRVGLEQHLRYLFQERISPEMLRGMPDETLRSAVRSAETLLMDGHSVARAADMAAMHLGAPNASRLLILGTQDAWKKAVLSGDVAPVYLKALSTAFKRFNMGEQDIMRLAESMAASEKTSVENALGYLAAKAGIPVESIDNKVAQQYLRSLQKQMGGDPTAAEVLRSLEEAVPEVAPARGIAAETPDISIDDLYPRTGRMIEEEGLLEDSEDIIQAVMGVGRQVEPMPTGPNIVGALEQALAEAAERRVPRKTRMKLVTEVGTILQGPTDEAAKAREATDRIRRFIGSVRKQAVGTRFNWNPEVMQWGR